MKKKNRLTKMPAPQTIKEAVTNLYAAFKRYEAPSQTLDVCLGCCVEPKIEREMRELPLESLYRHHFYRYNDSAKSEIQPASEIKYFIPRMLDLLSKGADLHHSMEIYLDRLGRVPEGTFSDTEKKALDDFALVFFAVGLEQMPFLEGGFFQRQDAFTVLLMFETGGFDISPLLEHWSQQNANEETLNYAYSTLWNFWDDDGVIGMAFASDRPKFREQMKTWILDSKNRQTFARKIDTCIANASEEFLLGTINNFDSHHDILNKVSQRIEY
jgi:hypothetical protein